MEGSKAFAKAFMVRHSIPTAAHKTFPASAFAGASEYVRTCGHDVVLKASGLAAGKGVLIPSSVDEAIEGLKEIMIDNVFGDAGPLLLLHICKYIRIDHNIHFLFVFSPIMLR